MSVWTDMQDQLARMDAEGMRRSPREVRSACGPCIDMGGRRVVCLCSNDYLGLANDPALKQAAIEAVGDWGVGSGGSRLVCGTGSLHLELERRLAEFKHVQAAAVTSTGWMANHAAIHSLAGPGDLVLCDKLNHASIIDAAASSGARLRTYPHRDTARAAKLLQQHRARHKRCLIVTDSLFSMDGDLAPLKELCRLKSDFDAQLLIDEAHATGVLGENGRGAAEMLAAEDEVDAVVGTLSKALGCLGGFIAGPAALIETIRNTARPYVFTTALPAALCAAAIAALEVVRLQPQRRLHLAELAQRLRTGLEAAGLDIGPSQSQIIPVILGQSQHAVQVSRRLLEAGFFIPAIRPPSVPRNTARLRISLSCLHEQADLDRLVGQLAAAAK